MKAICRFDVTRRAAALVAIVVLWNSAGSACGATYRILDLGTLGGDVSQATGINNRGQVVGFALTASGLPHAFRTAPNEPINPATDDLGTFGGGISYAWDINASGQVVGEAQTAVGVGSRAFRTGPNQPINPATDDIAPSEVYGVAYGINDSGQVVGSAGHLSEAYGFRTGPNQPINPATDYMDAGAYGINNSGQVVGLAQTVSGEYHAFRTAPNEPFNPATDDLGTLGGDLSWAHCINDSGQVVGWSVTATGEVHAFRTAPNQPINPATDNLGPAAGEVFGINNRGQVVGSNVSHQQGWWWEPPDPRFFAWVYSGNGPMQYLNELIDPASGWVLYEPQDINDLGQIVGWGTHNGDHRAFLLTPIPEPASTLALSSILGMTMIGRMRRGTVM